MVVLLERLANSTAKATNSNGKMNSTETVLHDKTTNFMEKSTANST